MPARPGRDRLCDGIVIRIDRSRDARLRERATESGVADQHLVREFVDIGIARTRERARAGLAFVALARIRCGIVQLVGDYFGPDEMNRLVAEADRAARERLEPGMLGDAG